jgi:hypothetical protein
MFVSLEVVKRRAYTHGNVLIVFLIKHIRRDVCYFSAWNGVRIHTVTYWLLGSIIKRVIVAMFVSLGRKPTTV